MADFNFTQISNNNGFYNLFVESSINDAGTVTFEAIERTCESIGGDCLQIGTTTPPAAIFTGNGDGSTTFIVDRSSYGGFSGYNSAVFFSPSTNNAGTTVLAASAYNSGQLIVPGPTAVLSGSGGGSTNTVAYSSTPFSITLVDPNVPFDVNNLAATGEFVSAPTINNAGTVAFVAGQNGETGIYSTSSGGAITIADTSGPLSNFYVGGLYVTRNANPFSAYTLPTINDSGTVAFNAGLDTGGRGIFTGSGGDLTTIADTTSGRFTYFSSPTLNDSGTVAFNAGLTTGGSSIFTSSDGNLTTIADTSGSFNSFISDVAINEPGNVAFLADLDNGTTGIFTGSDSGFNEVIAVGDTLGGSTVTQLRISRNGLNDAGQIAFDAVLADGTQRVFRADPIAVPESGSSALFALAILGMVGIRWRRRMQFAKHARH